MQIKKISQKRDDILFIIAGDGNLLKKLKEKVQRYNLQNYTKFLGSVELVEEIYAISDITLNCSIKEGLALTSYESLSMGVPVISSDVGGQAELINCETGKILPCIQKETDINNTNYSENEIDLYVEAIEEIEKKLEYYNKNARERILNQFTLEKMIENMEKVFEETISNPNQEKIENAKGLAKNINIMKEIFSMKLITNKVKAEYQIELYQKQVYGQVCNGKRYNHKKELIKEKLWTYPIWRKFVLISKKLLGRGK